MYYPKQIPYLLDKTFQKNIDYREYHFQELESYCMCIWQMKSKHSLDQTIYNFILPDACIDLVIDFSKKEMCFSGFSKETEQLELSDDVDYLGVRFKPGAFHSIFGMEASKIMDTMTPFSKIEKKEFLTKIFVVEKTKRMELLKEYLIQKGAKIKENQFLQIVDTLYHSPTENTVIKIAKTLDYNERKLYRVFKKNYGISPLQILENFK